MQRQIGEELKEVVRKNQTHPEFLGINIEHVDERSALDNTMLHLAAGTGALSDITLLVQHGADLNAPGDLGYTPLHMAVLMKQKFSLKLLLELGADHNIRNEFGQTPKDLAESIQEPALGQEL